MTQLPPSFSFFFAIWFNPRRFDSRGHTLALPRWALHLQLPPLLDYLSQLPLEFSSLIDSSKTFLSITTICRGVLSPIQNTQQLVHTNGRCLASCLVFDPTRQISRKMTGSTLRRASTLNETLILDNSKKFALKFDLNNNNRMSQDSDEAEAEELVKDSSFAWSWPFCTEGLAHGAYTKEKFLVCLPFNKGGTGEKNGTTRKFERIAESGLSWSMGLSRDAELGSTCFWRLEIEIHKNLNSIVLIASRDISRYNENTKRLKRIRKVYKLPHIYDVSTTKTTMYDWAVVVEAYRRHINRPLLKRTESLF